MTASVKGTWWWTSAPPTGVNSALLSHGLTVSELYAHHERDDITDPECRTKEARRFFAASRCPDAVPVTGLDVSVATIDYGVSAGILSAWHNIQPRT